MNEHSTVCPRLNHFLMLLALLLLLFVDLLRQPTARKVAGAVNTSTSPRRATMPQSSVTNANGSSTNKGIWSTLFGGNGAKKQGNITTLIKPRKAPIKVEPKVFFANERTFLAWLHISIILAGGSIAILAFADEQNAGSQLYGVILLPVALAFIVYAMHQYTRRAYMIRNKHPGPYEDTVGPTVLGVMLMMSIVAQFAIKLYSMSSSK
mmetsp:Transcript_19006/g.53990  ORF Transcript_19006/g.53990 Transcript_19006/m.53990 type:complete len:208 (-) Transcript_19006:200-823(-)